MDMKEKTSPEQKPIHMKYEQLAALKYSFTEVDRQNLQFVVAFLQFYNECNFSAIFCFLPGGRDPSKIEFFS